MESTKDSSGPCICSLPTRKQMDGWDKFLRVILHNTNRQLVYEPKAPSKYPLQCPKILKYSIPDKIETIRDLLFFLPEEEFEVTLNDGMICNDLYEKDLSIYSFPTVNAAHWKRQIYKDGLPDQRYTNYGKFDAQNAAIILEISDAVGLCAKETKSTSNPFVCVYYRNLEWHSKIVKGTVNPKFGFSFPVVLAADEVMNIVVWNIGKKLRFLGQVELGFTDLMELRESKSFKLLKRGRFSHVKGCLNIKTIVLDKTNRSELMEKGLQLVPFDIQEKLKLLIQRIYRLTYKDKKMELLELKAALLKMLKKHWGIQDSELAEYEFEIIAGYYLEDLIPLKELNSCWQKFTSYHDKDSDAARSLKELMTNVLKTILDHFGNFLELMNSAKIGVPKNGKDLQLLVELAEGIEIYVPDHKIDDIPSYFQKSITKSAEIYYQKIFDDLSSQDTQFLLLDLTDIIIDNLETLSRNYDILILDRLHPPSIIVNVFYGYLQTRYQDFSSDFDNDWNDLYDILELYKQVRKLQIVSEKIDFKLADKFPMSQWFKPFIEKWFSSSSIFR